MEVVATFASAATKLLLRSPISIARALQCELISERCMMIASCLCHANVHCCRMLSYPPPRHYLHLVTFRVRDCLRNAENDPSIIINYNRIMINSDQQMYNFMFFGTSQLLLLFYGLKELVSIYDSSIQILFSVI